MERLGLKLATDKRNLERKEVTGVHKLNTLLIITDSFKAIIFVRINCSQLLSIKWMSKFHLNKLRTDTLQCKAEFHNEFNNDYKLFIFWYTVI